jgi:hypothetical protein
MPSWTGLGGQSVEVGRGPKVADAPSVMAEYGTVLVAPVWAGVDETVEQALLPSTPTQ